MLLPIYLLKLLLDAFAEKGQYDFDYILWILMGFAAVKVTTILIANITNYVALLQADVVMDNMSNRIISKAIDIDLAYFDIDTYHDVYQRAVWQQGRPIEVLNLVSQLIQHGISLVAIAGLLFTLHWGVAFLLFFIALPTAGIRWYYAEKSIQLREKQTPQERRAFYYHDILTNNMYAKEVRTFDYGQHLLKTFLKIRKKIRKEKRQLYGYQSKSISMAQSLEAVAIIAALGLIAKRAFTGLLSVGDIAMYYQLFQRGQSNINNLFGTIVQVQENKLHIRHLFDFLKLEKQITNPRSPLPFPTTVEKLSVEGVHFTYPQTQKEILTNLSFAVNKGEIVAIVGENGSGKTTLVKLINRLYQPNKGQIKINGIPISQFEVADLRRKITVVFQQFAKYYTSVQENIQLADVHSDWQPQRLAASADYAQATDFINRLPKKQATQLGRIFENGEELSGGQWQKIALTRAFYKAAEIIVLDEPTSMIDPIAEDEIFTNLRAIAQNKILLLITHRIYNLKMCDQILVMDKGQLVEVGNHETLMAKKGRYWTMFEKQT